MKIQENVSKKRKKKTKRCHNMTCHRVCDQSNTTGVTCGAGTAYPFGTPGFTSGFSVVLVALSLVFLRNVL